jgi:hypothetical protein
MFKRAFQFFLISSLVTGALWAADDLFVGDWKLNPSRSKLTDVMKVETFAEAGKQSRAMEFLALDVGSEWMHAVRVAVLMRQGKTTEARQASPQMTDNPIWMKRLVQACLDKGPQTEIHAMAESAENELLPKLNPELKYMQAATLAACGEKEIAYKFLSQAVAGNYCANQALKSDPLLAGVRGDEAFRQVQLAAQKCQNRFLAEGNQSP